MHRARRAADSAVGDRVGVGRGSRASRAMVFRRSSLSAFVVTPQAAAFAMRLEGRLYELMEAPELYPIMRIRASGGSVVARVRSGQVPTVCLTRVSDEVLPASLEQQVRFDSEDRYPGLAITCMTETAFPRTATIVKLRPQSVTRTLV